MSVPKLRFKEFQKDWQKKIISDLVQSLDAGVSVNSEDREPIGSEYSILKTSCVTSGIFEQQERKAVTEAIEISRLKEPLLDNSIIISRMNTPLLVGANAYIKSAPKNTFLPDRLWQVKIYQHLVNMDWLSQWLSNERNFEKIRNLATGTSNSMKNISKSDVMTVDISVPDLAEQTKIANFLTAIDEKITQLTQKHDLLKQYKKGVMQQIFSQKLRFKDDDGREFPEWEEQELKDIAQIVGGGTPETGIKEYWNGDIQWYTPTELKSKYAAQSQRTITESGFKNSSAKILPVGTLLFSSRATVGDVSIALNPCTTNQGFQSLIVNDKNNNEFIYYWILSNKKAFLEKASGSTFLEISKKEIEKLSIQRPGIKEQTKIANFLTAIDDKITHTQTQLDAVKLYKKGLLQQLFV